MDQSLFSNTACIFVLYKSDAPEKKFNNNYKFIKFLKHSSYPIYFNVRIYNK